MPLAPRKIYVALELCRLLSRDELDVLAEGLAALSRREIAREDVVALWNTVIYAQRAHPDTPGDKRSTEW